MKIIVPNQIIGRWRVLEESPERATKRRGRVWLCQCECGTIRPVRAADLNRSTGASHSCGCARIDTLRRQTGERNPYWKGGRYYDKHGYLWLSGEDYPGKKRHDQMEHIIVMARHLNRPIRKGEIIHHKNGIRDDNRIDNLELWSTSHPAGQRIEDKIAWCYEFLEQYASSPK